MAPSTTEKDALVDAVNIAQTTGIGVGSGAVLMNHYSPFKAAEMFKQLEAMFAGRIDLGTGRAFAGNKLMPTVREVPQTWLLGSSPGGSNLAAGLGIGYTFAGFINPRDGAAALRHYREQFRPQGFGLDEPRATLAVNVNVSVGGQWPQFVAGSPAEVRATLEQMIEESGADEVMVQNMIADPAQRRHSHALLAETFGLTSREIPSSDRTEVTKAAASR